MDKINNKGICRYGSDCYRINPLHLKEYTHPHIENIIKSKKIDGKYKIPDDLFVTEEILLKQIEIIEPYVKKSSSDVENTTKTKNLVAASPATTAANSSPKASPKLNKYNNNNNKIDENPEKKLKLDLKQANDKKVLTTPSKNMPPKLEPIPSTSSATSSSSPYINNKASSSKLELKEQQKQKHQPQQTPQKPRHRVEDYVSVIVPRGRMAQKLENAKPYNFFLTAITASKPTHNEPLSVTFQEILDKSLGEIESSVQINFMVDVGWLLAHYYFSENDDKPMLILYGDETPELRMVSTKKPHITAIKVEMSGPFGTHHTKMMIFGYKDGSMRIVISTANLYEDDWHNRTQGIWISPACPKLPDDADTAAGESPTQFKDSMLKYLLAYKLPKLQPWIVRVRKTDFSQINVFLITSTPGGHRSNPQGPLFGHPRLGYVLEKHCAFVPDTTPIVVQSSSIGSLGPNVNSWISEEFYVSLRKDSTPASLRRIPEFRMIYPSFDNVINGHDGILSGGCLPYGKATNDKQPWLKNYLYQWKAKSRHRNQAIPHIKTYCRWSEDKLAWFCLTSANLSKAAWGVYNKSAKFERPLRIMNYEAGVLFLPKFVIEKDYFSREDFPMPYDVPLIKYGIDDVPFVCDLIQ